MSRPALGDLQHVFWDLITAPEGAAAGLTALPERESRLPDGLDAWIASDERLSAVERLDVYANMYFYRLLDVLRDDFSAVAKVVGERHFHNLITAYLLRHPSTSRSIRDVGLALPTFLEGHPLSAEWTFLPDLARFEWAMRDAFDGPDAEAVPAEKMQAIAPEDWAATSFLLAPTLLFLSLSAPVHRIFRSVADGEPVPEIDLVPTELRLWRKDFQVLYRTMEPPEAAALAAALAGEDFGGICETVAAVTSSEEAPGIAAQILRTWFADALVVGLR